MSYLKVIKLNAHIRLSILFKSGRAFQKTITIQIKTSLTFFFLCIEFVTHRTFTLLIITINDHISLTTQTYIFFYTIVKIS